MDIFAVVLNVVSKVVALDIEAFIYNQSKLLEVCLAVYDPTNEKLKGRIDCHHFIVQGNLHLKNNSHLNRKHDFSFVKSVALP